MFKMHRKTEEEVARVEHDLQDIDEEIRQLEYQARMEEDLMASSRNDDGRRVTFQHPLVDQGDQYLPVPEFGGGGNFVGPYYGPGGYNSNNNAPMAYGYGGVPFLSPLAGPYVFAGQQGQAQQQQWPNYYYPSPPPGPGTYYYPPQVPMYNNNNNVSPQRPQTPQQVMSSQDYPPQSRERSGTQSLEELQAMSAKKSVPADRADLGAVLRSSALFTLSMMGEAVFFMVRDWFDTTKNNRARQNRGVSIEQISMEDSVAVAALEQLEKMNKGEALTQRQKMRHVKSVRQLMRATSVRDVIDGLRNAGRQDEAESLGKRLLAIRQQMYGDDHIATAQAWNQLGGVLCQEEDFEQAIQAFEQALNSLRTAFKYHPKGTPAIQEARIMHNLASAKLMFAKSLQAEADPRERGEFDPEQLKQQGLQLGLEVCEFCEKRLGEKHKKTVQYKRVWVPGFAANYVKPESASTSSNSPKEPANATPLPVDLVIKAATKTE